MARSRLKVLPLHDEIDAESGRLAKAHEARLQCKKGCHQCCVDDLSIFEVEAQRIGAEFGELLREESPAPAGGCAFLDNEGACRIYAARPYVCRTQGLPLRWFDQAADEAVEYRDICPLNEECEPREALEPEQGWLLGPFEARLAALQANRRRVKLRDLF